MPKGVPAPEGSCQADGCKETGRLYASTERAGKMLCKRCRKREKNAAYSAKQRGAAQPAKPAAPKQPRPEPSAQQRPAQASGAPLSLTFRVTLEKGHTVGSLMDILRALPFGAELVW